jgi:signal transduction histidine kinase
MCFELPPGIEFDDRMKTSTRLILLLTMAVSGVMALVGYLGLQLRADALEAAARDEVRAHAITLRIALEEDYATGRQLDAQRLLDRLRENTGIYGVILFNEEGVPTVLSENMARAEIVDTTEARHVIATGEEKPIRRTINRTPVLSLMLPIQLDAQRRGAMEISLPVSFVEDGIAQERRIILAFLVALCITIFFVVALVTRYSLVKPVGELLAGAAALERGELQHHVQVPSHNKEFSTLAAAFNRMADSLDEQQRAAALAAEERLQLERRLRHQERLAVVGRLAAGVAHEIGAPLHVIDGRAKQLQDQPEASQEKRQRNLSIIRTQTERITRIVRNLLDFSRPFHPRPRPVEAAEVMAVVLEACELQAQQNNVVIAHEVLPRPLLVTADAGLLQQVFMNICVNALHAMPDGGTLRIDYITGAVVKDGQAFTMIRIADTGGGIAPDNLPHIFDPYFTTKQVGHGTGLGLAVASRIIEDHGGWIEASNWEKGHARGALFAVYLSAATAEAGVAVANPVTVAANTN